VTKLSDIIRILLPSEAWRGGKGDLHSCSKTVGWERVGSIKTAPCTEQFRNQQRYVLTNNVPVFYMARVMILMRAISITKGWALKSRLFLGPEMATSEASHTGLCTDRLKLDFAGPLTEMSSPGQNKILTLLVVIFQLI
jgi:hypothetical protein